MNQFNHNGGFVGGGFIATPTMNDIYRLERRIEELEARLKVLEPVVEGGEGEH